MHSTIFDRMILGTVNSGQGSVMGVEGTHRLALRVLIAKFARRLALRLGALTLQRIPVATTPAVATCPSPSARRRQRDQRWMPGLVVDARAVGARR